MVGRCAKNAILFCNVMYPYLAYKWLRRHWLERQKELAYRENHGVWH